MHPTHYVVFDHSGETEDGNYCHANYVNATDALPAVLIKHGILGVMTDRRFEELGFNADAREWGNEWNAGPLADKHPNWSSQQFGLYSAATWMLYRGIQAGIPNHQRSAPYVANYIPPGGENIHVLPARILVDTTIEFVVEQHYDSSSFWKVEPGTYGNHTLQHCPLERFISDASQTQLDALEADIVALEKGFQVSQ